jgi:hypothetical protein
MKTKICGKCKEEKDICFFGRDKKTKDGLKWSCNECRKLESKLYRENNKEKRSETLKKFYEKNKEKELLRFKTYRENNKEKRKETIQKSNKKNRIKRNESARNWKKSARLNDPKYKLICNLRTRTKHFLLRKNFNKNCSTKELVGCTPEFLKEHMEKQFKDGMTWENYGFYGWHIDHIIPLSSAKTDEELYKLCHYSNLQPLWANENLSKGSKIL